MKRGEKFRILADELRRGIAEVRWPEGRLPTEQQLAAEQGVSLNTVRRAVDLLVADGLVYRRQGSGTYVAPTPAVTGPLVGVVIPSMTYYYPRIIAAIETALASRGAQMLLRSTGYHVDVEEQAIASMANVDGLLLVPELAGQVYPHKYLESLPAPTVLVERQFHSGADIYEFVCTNHGAGGYLAARHLLDLGHTRVAYLGRNSPHAAHVIRGLNTGIDEAGRKVVLITTSPRVTSEVVDGFLDDAFALEATAVLCFADREAAMVVTAARRRGLSVPGDLSVIGYDDEVADLSDVPLTSVSPAKHEVGAVAVETLLRRLAEPDAPLRQHLVVPRLVVRESTGIHSPSTS
ncbi:substrate-binding domain-containing protein [Nonomuraea sp. NPDC050556]|uniref:substrate-binding domain-containing protein n=1 Tax=Nonomuraea sp. NPDC050556 TaxID=3364369 RepID=UPI003792FFAF